MMLQDEEETQIQVTMYGSDITHYENEFVPFQTYLLSGAFVTESTKAYGNPLHQLTWTFDKGTIVEPIEQLTLWEEFIDLYGNKLLTHLKELQEFPIIVARKVAKPKSTSGLSNRFGTTIQIDPPYPQAIALKTWNNEIKPLLSTYTTKSTTTTGSLLFVPFEEHIVPIVNIQAKYSMCKLNCQYCKQIFPKNWSQRRFYCTTCRRSTHLTSTCQFEVNIQDDTGSTTAMISDKIGEELLSLWQKFMTYIKQLLPLIPVQHKLLGKTFTIQIKKMFAKNKDDIASNLPLLLTAPTTPESSKRKLKQIMTKED
ncbi:hypothetical protein R3W88_011514 [Solanum pinnatisectum]|uniref:Replication factor A C-terminal domain-containing protein n=1 Tax=Solanum pinnatisectum TaxID=50273 RepID=A0AAV9L6E2_9SOLN|nr:hypothetical protein R3W88_011514 [Solanum pinnatisectum]